MNEEQIRFLSVQEAMQIVAAIQEEEDIHNPGKRILTVYNHDDREVCWFDYDELIEAVGPVAKGELKEAVQNYILMHIPDWALDL
ncbi:MAG: hypothetical protein F9K32_08105 [Desulfobulbaceae bacterium]|nr:MAG: hypothetical protein F9K32_08105 [Desulfobulbaceae bacterium]